MATSTKFWNFFNLEKFSVRKLENFTKLLLLFLNVFYFYLKVFSFFKEKSEPTQWPVAAVAQDNNAWLKKNL